MSALLPGGVTLVLGGARSGKSDYAEGLVRDSGLDPVYLATGRAWDSEMENRISEHRKRRGEEWQTVEEPVDLVGALERLSDGKRAVLVDCLTLWLTNLMLDERDVAAESRKLCDAMAVHPANLVVVSNEVGLGIVPENKMARAFRDYAGRLHQDVARIAHTVWFMAAGLPLRMKG